MLWKAVTPRTLNMASTRPIRRYTAFFRGWAQAFGEHRLISDPRTPLRWLIGEHQLGLILTADSRRQLYALFLRRSDRRPPTLTWGAQSLRLDQADWPLGQAPTEVRAQAERLLSVEDALHLFQTYHLVFAPGTRILTLSQRAPLPLLYREIDAIELVLDLEQPRAPGSSDRSR